jgi:hypothetical protein
MRYFHPFTQAALFDIEQKIIQDLQTNSYGSVEKQLALEILLKFMSYDTFNHLKREFNPDYSVYFQTL